MKEKSGLRERKKQQTRLSISQVATRMFIERGFDKVTIAEVAEAAEVSVNTIFNYFTTKEELFFDLGEEVVAAPSRAIRERRVGESVIEALHRSFRGMLQDETGPFEAKNIKPFIATIQASVALQMRALLLLEQSEQRLAKTLEEETGAPAEDPTAKVVAALVTGLVRLLVQEFRAGVLRNESIVAHRAFLAQLGEKGFALLHLGVGSYGRRVIL